MDVSWSEAQHDGLNWFYEGDRGRSVTPPTWSSSWAKCLYVLATIVLVFFVYLGLEKKPAQERAVVSRLEKLNMIKDDFLTNMDHELRTSEGIIGLSESLINGATGPLSEKTQKQLAKIAAAGRRLSGLINKVLDISNLKNSELERDPPTNDLKAASQEITTPAAPLLETSPAAPLLKPALEPPPAEKPKAALFSNKNLAAIKQNRTDSLNVKAGKRFKILIVDDEPTNRKVLRNLLSTEQYQLMDAGGGFEAQTLIEDGKVPDLMLLDVMMPCMSGYQLCRVIRQTFSINELPIIFLTAKIQERDLVEAFACGGNDYLTKPFSNVELLTRTRTHLTMLETSRSLKATLKELVHSERFASMGKMVAGITHEINTPLGVVAGAASHLVSLTDKISTAFSLRTAGKEDMQNYFLKADQSGGLILRNIKRATELIKSYKLLTADQTSGQRHHFNLSNYLDEIVTGLKPVLKEKFRVVIQCPSEIVADNYPGALFQVITNLVVNSVRHGFGEGQGGEIKLEAWTCRENVLIDCSDNGKGIAEEDLEHIFEPFFTRGRDRGGSGLGLHIVSHIVSNIMKGSIECESKPGHGTIFHLSFPSEVHA